MLSLASIIAADATPFISALPKEIDTVCGPIGAILVAGIIWLASQLAKERKCREADRASMLKNDQEKTAAYERMASAHAELRGMILSMQMARGAGDDDD